MPIAMPMTIDPLKSFIAGASTTTGRPIPLVSTRFDVDIDGGLATVVTKRVFRNDETESIEATITFPVPVHAVLFSLEARVDGRVLKARAQKRAQARETYEDAIERGKTAVLHEEVLRGVHMLSVAHLGPGKEIEVTSTWVSALSFVGDRGQIRIPLTVGDIYGRSQLPDSDDLLTGGPVQTGDLFVRCANGVVEVSAARLDDAHTRIALNAPIDLFVTNVAARGMRGLAADGREVVLRVSPRQGGETPLNAAIVVDRSGSMGAACASGQTGVITVLEAAVSGLRNVAQGLGGADIVDLWEFDDQLKHVGKGKSEPLLARIARLRGPGGGTEIGAALSGTIAGSAARDILLITDGKSHALDVHELACKGRRITVVLVGEDSLEANVGHLAALSGGDIFVATGDDIADSLTAAIGSLRAPSGPQSAVGASLDHVHVIRGNAVLEAEWRPATGEAHDAVQSRGVAAMAASLALSVLAKEQAAALAEAEGLVTHLTSLVLVDEAGEAQQGVPANRKIALPEPAVAALRCRVAAPIAPAGVYASAGPPRAAAPAPRQFKKAGRRSVENYPAPPQESPRGFSDSGLVLPGVGLRIDWDISPNQLLAGDFSALDPQDAAVIKHAGSRPEVVALAKQFNLDPTVLVIALIARLRSATNRSAARLAKAILGDRIPEDMLLAITAMLGLA
jgi:Vault protein inter-alpha-trypsin domain